MMTADYILLLEDNVLVAMEVEDELAARGYAVACAVDLAEAGALVAARLPRLALLDLRLPDGDSAELARQLLAQGCPVALISGADSGRIPEFLGAVPRFPKPAAAWQVADWVDNVLAHG